jgi:hypothetical protein
MVVLRRAGVVLIVVTLALGLGGPIAGAKKKGKKWGSKITVQHPSPTRLAGAVDSGLAACFKGRLVNVFFTDPTGNSALLSVQRTDGKGRYEVNLPQPAFSGVYQAQAVRERVRAHKTGQTCRAADSAILAV